MDIQFKQTIKIFVVLFGVLLFGVLLGISLVRIGYIPAGGSLVNGVDVIDEVNKKEIIVNLIIDYGNGNTQTFSKQSLRTGESVLDLLEQNEVSLDKRNFPGVGVFIEAINGVHNSNSYYWQYWVNGEYAKVAAELYKLKDGDEVLWKRTNELPQ